MARLLAPKLDLSEMQQIVNELRTIHNMLTRFELAQQDLGAQARDIEQRRKELTQEEYAEYQRQSDARGRRAAKPIG